jgi:PEP-CTERM motif
MSKSSHLSMAVVFAGLVALGVLPAPGWTQVVPPARPVNAAYNGTVNFDFGTADVNDIGGGLNQGSATGIATVTPGLVTSVSGSALDPAGSTGSYLAARTSATASLYYYFSAYGPGVGVSVPLLISATAGANANAVTGATADGGGLVVWASNEKVVGELITGVACNGPVCTANTATPGVPAGDVSVGAHGINIENAPFTTTSLAKNAGPSYASYAEIQAEGNVDDGTGVFSAFADPVIEIDPTWLATHPGYYLVFSANVNAPAGTGTGPGSGTGPGTGTSGVPEPGTLLLALLGIAGIVLWPRRRVAAAAA